MNVRPALYAVNVAALVQDDGLFEKVHAAVTPARREKADRYRRREDAALSLGVELLLRYAYAQVGEPFPTAFSKTAQGKPFAPDSSLHFSLSHSGEWALCAVGDDEVGCDVEKIDPAHIPVADRVCTANEKAQLAAADEEDRVFRFFRMWTMKESFIKAAATRFDSTLSNCSVVLGNPSRVEGESATFAEYTDLLGYACAMCLCSGGELPPLQIVELEDLLK